MKLLIELEIHKTKEVIRMVRVGQAVNFYSKGFSKGFFFIKIKTKGFSNGLFIIEIKMKRFSKRFLKPTKPQSFIECIICYVYLKTSL